MTFWIGAFFITVLVIGFSMFAFLVIDSFRRWVKAKWHAFKKFCALQNNKFSYLKMIWKTMGRSYTSYSLEMLFQAFIKFYESNIQNLDNWAYVDGVYSKPELTEMYKWIKKVRPSNYEESANIDYDEKQQMFLYFGAHYNFLKYKIDVDGELKIHPQDTLEGECSMVDYTRMMVKLQNMLYEMDTMKAQWILERRKFLCI